MTPPYILSYTRASGLSPCSQGVRAVSNTYDDDDDYDGNDDDDDNINNEDYDDYDHDNNSPLQLRGQGSLQHLWVRGLGG
jgi:hypothetical protein